MRYPWAVAGPGQATSGRPTLQTSSNQRDSNRLARTSVTNVVNLSPKTSIFSEKADGLTTFVTTGQKSTRKTPWIDDVCNNTHRATRQHTKPHWRGGRRRAWLQHPWAAAGPGRASRRRASHTPAHPAPLVWRAPEGPEGTGGLRGTAPNKVRPPSLAGGRALRRPEHPWRHKQPGPPAQHNKTRPRPVARPRPRHAHAAPFTTAPPAIRRSCPRGPRPRRGQPRGGQRGRGTGSRTRSRHPRCGRSGSTAGRHRAHHTRRA